MIQLILGLVLIIMGLILICSVSCKIIMGFLLGQIGVILILLYKREAEKTWDQD